MEQKVIKLLTAFFLCAALAAQGTATVSYSLADASGTRDFEVDATGTTGTIEVYVNGILQTWNPAADPVKQWSVQQGGTFEVRTSKRALKLTNVSATQVDQAWGSYDNTTGIDIALNPPGDA